MVIVVLAEVPLAGRCLKPLIPYNDEGWLARLAAAMLRDTLDGLEAVPAERYVVLADTDDEGRRVLERHLPVPWTLASSPSELDVSDGFIVATTLAPAADIAKLIELAANESFAVIGQDERQNTWLVGERASCKDLVTLPLAKVVETQPLLDALCDELRQHHERAPRTAQLAMTS